MKSIKIETIEDPSNEFTQDEKDTLAHRLTEVARNGFGTPITFNDVHEHLFSGDFLHLLSLNDRLVGFSSYKRVNLPQGNVLFFNGTVIEKGAQKSGLYKIARVLALSEEKPQFIALRTQSPVVYGVAQSLVEKIYPNGLAPPDQVRLIAKHFGGELMEEDTFVCRGFYGKSLYDKIPEYNGVKRFFEGPLRMKAENGDALIVVGEVK